MMPSWPLSLTLALSLTFVSLTAINNSIPCNNSSPILNPKLTRPQMPHNVNPSSIYCHHICLPATHRQDKPFLSLTSPTHQGKACDSNCPGFISVQPPMKSIGQNVPCTHDPLPYQLYHNHGGTLHLHPNLLPYQN